MFVAEEVTLSVGVDGARMRLANLVSGGVLDAASRATYLEQGVALLPVGPVRGISKLVKVRMRGPVTRGETSLVTLRWEVVGAGGALFPVLDADLTLRAGGDAVAVLRLDGSYRPPLGLVGASLDRAVLGHVAAATARAFLRQVADAIVSAEPTAAAGPPNAAQVRWEWQPGTPIA
jgi:hypothetical protein